MKEPTADQPVEERLVHVTVNDVTARMIAGRVAEPEFRRMLLRAYPRAGADYAIGIRARPDEHFISVVEPDAYIDVHDGLEVCTAPRDSEITIDVNSTPVGLLGPIHSVASIKSAAEAQGADVPDSYVLGLVFGRRDVEDLSEDQVLFVLTDSCFVAVGNDDNA